MRQYGVCMFDEKPPIWKYQRNGILSTVTHKFTEDPILHSKMSTFSKASKKAMEPRLNESESSFEGFLHFFVKYYDMNIKMFAC